MAEVWLREQFGAFEAVPGTPETPVRRIYAELRPNVDKPPIDLPEYAGTYDDWYTHGMGPMTVDVPWTEGLTFEDAGWLLSIGYDGDSTLSTVDTSARQRVFTPNPSADDLKRATIELHRAECWYQFVRSIFTTFTIRGDIDTTNEPWMFEGSLIPKVRNRISGITGGSEPGDRTREY